MNIKLLTFAFSALLSLLICSTLTGAIGYNYNTGYSVSDLDSQTYDCFSAEAKSWSVTNLIGSADYTTCSGSYIIGGYNIMGPSNNMNGQYYSKTYSNLQAHNMIYFTFTLFRIDSLDNNDYFNINFDNAVLSEIWYMPFQSYSTQTNYCGSSSYTDLINVRVFGRVVHSGSSVSIKFVMKNDQGSTDESYGWRDLKFELATASSSPATTQFICAYHPAQTFSTGNCPCAEGYYYSSSCQVCHAACSSCFGSAATDCYQCASGYGWTGTACVACNSSCTTCRGTGVNQCNTCPSGSVLYNGGYCPVSTKILSPLTSAPSDTCGNSASTSSCTSSQFVYWDSSCSSTCNAPLQQNNATSYLKYCIYPCSTTQFLYWNGTCATSCSSPLNTAVSNSKNFCNYPCTSGSYLYYNGTCATSCGSPLVTRLEAGNYYCDYPCASTQFLYWDGTCQTSCTNPVSPVAYGSKQFCLYPCATSQFLYRNGTCANACNSPLVNSTSNNRKFCSYPCTSSQYLYWNGTCASSCASPLTNLAEAGKNYCNYPCASNQYLYWNGTCASSCASPLVTKVEAGRNYCSYPCASGQYLYWNGSCPSSCASPLVTKVEAGKNYCSHPCASGQYLYYNGTCSGVCNSPLSTRTEAGKLYCDYQCSFSQYLYWDGTCQNSCSSPLQVVNYSAKQFCLYPCLTSQYLYWDGTCQANCNFPLSSSNISKALFCKYPCQTSQYLYWNGSCEASCLFPLLSSQKNGANFCNQPCADSQYLFESNTCLNSCETPMQIQIENSEQICLSPCQDPSQYYYPQLGQCESTCSPPNVIQTGLYKSCLVRDTSAKTLPLSLARIIHYIKYMDIQFPPRLQMFSSKNAENLIPIRYQSEMPKSLRQEFTKLLLPPIFEKYGICSNFLVNYWGDLISLIFTFCMAVITWSATLVLKNLDKFRILSIAKQFENIFKWNFLIILIASGIDYIMFFLSLYFHKVSFHNNGDKFSFYTSLLILTATLVLMLFILKHLILSLQSKSIIFVGDEPDFDKSQRKTQHHIQILSQGIKQERAFHRLFYIIYTFRLAFPSIIASSLYTNPQAQTALYLITSISILTYLILTKPFIKKINQVQLIILESIILFIHICLLALTVLKMESFEDTEATIVLGDMIIAGNYILHVHAIIFLIIKLVLEIRKLYILKKTQQKIPEMPWLQFIVIYIQQGGMGFEEITLELVSNTKIAPMTTITSLSTSNIVFWPSKIPKDRMLKRSTVQTMTSYDNTQNTPTLKGIKRDGISPGPFVSAAEKSSDQYISDNQGLEKDEYQSLDLKSEKPIMSSVIYKQSLYNVYGMNKKIHEERSAFVFSSDERDSVSFNTQKRVNLLEKSKFGKAWRLDLKQSRLEGFKREGQPLSLSNLYLNNRSPKMDS